MLLACMRIACPSSCRMNLWLPPSHAQHAPAVGHGAPNPMICRGISFWNTSFLASFPFQLPSRSFAGVQVSSEHPKAAKRCANVYCYFFCQLVVFKGIDFTTGNCLEKQMEDVWNSFGVTPLCGSQPSGSLAFFPFLVGLGPQNPQHAPHFSR